MSSYLLLPIQTRSTQTATGIDRIGVLTLTNKFRNCEISPFTEGDAELCKALARQLYSVLSRRRTELVLDRNRTLSDETLDGMLEIYGQQKVMDSGNGRMQRTTTGAQGSDPSIAARTRGTLVRTGSSTGRTPVFRDLASPLPVNAAEMLTPRSGRPSQPASTPGPVVPGIPVSAASALSRHSSDELLAVCLLPERRHSIVISAERPVSPAPLPVTPPRTLVPGAVPLPPAASTALPAPAAIPSASGSILTLHRPHSPTPPSLSTPPDSARVDAAPLARIELPPALLASASPGASLSVSLSATTQTSAPSSIELSHRRVGSSATPSPALSTRMRPRLKPLSLSEVPSDLDRAYSLKDPAPELTLIVDSQAEQDEERRTTPRGGARLVSFHSPLSSPKTFIASSFPSVPSSQMSQLRDSLCSVQFNPFDFSENDLLPLAYLIFQELGFLERFSISETLLKSFLVAVKNNYRDNPYHSFYHGFSVLQFTYYMLKKTGKGAALAPKDQLALIVASLCHDIDHPGTNNPFQVAAQTNLAIAHNDQHVLEMHHAFLTFALLRDPKLNFLSPAESSFTPEDFRVFRRLVIQAILATDMVHHFELCSTIDKTEAINIEKENEKQFLINIITHGSDLAAQTLPTRIACEWEKRVTEEFMLQADTEKAMGIPSAAFMQNLDVELVRYRAHLGFLNFVMVPLWKGITVNLFPELKDSYEQLNANRKYYQELIEQLEREEKTKSGAKETMPEAAESEEPPSHPQQQSEIVPRQPEDAPKHEDANESEAEAHEDVGVINSLPPSPQLKSALNSALNSPRLADDCDERQNGTPVEPASDDGDSGP
jgi:hypothetical protein